MTTNPIVRAILLSAIITLASMTTPAAESSESSDAERARMLERLADTADLYRERARSFTCEETIRWNRKGDDGRQRFGYVVIYDEQRGFEDYRTRLKGGNRKRPPKRVEPTDYGVPAYLRSVYLWPFIFKANRQPFHEYEIVGSEQLFDRPAVLIRFRPLAPYRPGVNEWVGTAWVDSETAQLLKVEAHHANEEAEMERLRRHRAGEAASGWTYHIERITTEYAIEQRGMRLPSTVELMREGYDMTRSDDGWGEDKRIVLWVSQSYSNYRFFGVEAEDLLEDRTDEEP